MKQVIQYITILCFFISLTSCKKFLDEQPKHLLTGDNAISNREKARAAVDGVYATFQNDNWAGGLYIAQATKAGFMRTSELGYNLSYTQNQSDGTPQIWTQFYKSLNAANFAIQGITALAADKISADERQLLIAEARCLRAWINANLLWNWAHWWADDSNEFGILYRDKLVELSNVQQARISVGESYQKIYEDLDFAIDKLGSFSSPRYMSKEFAKVLKAKLLLYRGGYRNNMADLNASLTLVNDVLNNHPATFKIEPSLSDFYKKSWDSQENLFVRYLEDDGTRHDYQVDYWYCYGLVYAGNRLPLFPGETLTAGLNYGLDWFSADPRWNIATGEVRGAENWDTGKIYAFKKLSRFGKFGGQETTPKDEKYAAYYFRFAELYLLKSELLARTGATIDQAIAPINQLRAQRTNPILTSLHPTTKDELMDLIFKEIFMELGLENGSEFFASLRFSKDGQPWIVATKGGKALEENRICWPIPDGEIINNKLMKQNPGLN